MSYLRLEKLIPHVAKLGFDSVEIVGERPHGWPSDYDRDGRKTLMKICRDEGVRVSSFCVGFGYFMQTGLADENVQIRTESKNYIRSLMELTSELDGDFTMIVPGRVLIGEDIEKGWKNATLETRELCDYADDLGIKIAIENMLARSELAYDPDTIMRFLNEVGSKNIGLTLDVGHLNVIGVSLSTFLGRMKDSILNVHISDNDGSNDSHGPIGSGNIDFRKLVNEIREFNYQGLLTFEILSSWRWTIQELDKAIASGRDSIMKILSS
jgi:sugar phosphate isomerase/epimerase